jgi:hypothetical protein
MVVVAHNGVRADIHTIDIGEFKDTIFHPEPAVFIRVPGIMVNTTQERAPDATRDAVVIWCYIERN